MMNECYIVVITTAHHVSQLSYSHSDCTGCIRGDGGGGGGTLLYYYTIIITLPLCETWPFITADHHMVFTAKLKSFIKI